MLFCLWFDADEGEESESRELKMTAPQEKKKSYSLMGKTHWKLLHERQVTLVLLRHWHFSFVGHSGWHHTITYLENY